MNGADTRQTARGKVLKDAGYEVILAKNAQEAVAEFNPPQIDRLLLDLNLSDR